MRNTTYLGLLVGTKQCHSLYLPFIKDQSLVVERIHTNGDKSLFGLRNIITLTTETALLAGTHYTDAFLRFWAHISHNLCVLAEIR